MERLKKLLTITPEEMGKAGNAFFENRFQEVAHELIQNYCIQKGNTTYRFLELEFYFYSNGHRDIITYPRQANAGDWHFHQSGLDICFQSEIKDKNEKGMLIPIEETEYYGGILVRNLRKISENNKNVEDDKNEYPGPLKCCYELFDRFSALKKNGEQYPHIVRKPAETDVEIQKCTRYFSFYKNETKSWNRFKNLGKRYSEAITYEDFKSFLFEKQYRFYDKSLSKISINV